MYTLIKAFAKNFFKHRATNLLSVGGLSLGMAIALLLGWWAINETKFVEKERFQLGEITTYENAIFFADSNFFHFFNFPVKSAGNHFSQRSEMRLSRSDMNNQKSKML